MNDETNELDDDCRLCRGTGIGQFGDPATSRCQSCGGSGVQKANRNEDEDDGDRAYDGWVDRQLEEGK